MDASGHDGSALTTAALAEAMRAALANRSPDQALHSVLTLTQTIKLCDHASITGRPPRASDTLHTLAASDRQIRTVDRLQYELGEGPALDALHTADLLHTPDLTTERRWPRWAEGTVARGIHGVITVRLYTSSTLGTLNLYTDRPRQHCPTDLHTAQVIAAHASAVLAHTETTRNLLRAIDSRNLIGQAQGILMARHLLTAGQAFQVLRTCSQNSNTRITALAEELTRTGLLLGRDTNEIITGHTT